LNQPKKTKPKSDLASNTVIDLDSDDAVDTVDLTKPSPLKSSQEHNLLKTSALSNLNISTQDNKKQKQPITSKFLIN
jgi:hypothetical protein